MPHYCTNNCGYRNRASTTPVTNAPCGGAACMGTYTITAEQAKRNAKRREGVIVVEDDERYSGKSGGGNKASNAGKR